MTHLGDGLMPPLMGAGQDEVDGVMHRELQAA
jgi:hypothetical protein